MSRRKHRAHRGRAGDTVLIFLMYAVLIILAFVLVYVAQDVIVAVLTT
jgi:hypothetical protein